MSSGISRIWIVATAQLSRYCANGVRERIPIRHKITEAETAPGLVGGFRYVPPQDLVPDWPATAQFTPPSAQRPVTQLHDGLEREQDCLRLDQRSVPISDWPGRSQRSQLITIVSTTTPTGRALVMPSQRLLERYPVLFWEVIDDKALARWQRMSALKSLVGG